MVNKYSAIILLFALWPIPLAAGDYEFCVTRISEPSQEMFGVRYHVGDIDPGKEALRVIVSQKYKTATTSSISVSDYDANTCGPIREEANVTMTGEQLQQLGQAIGNGDLAGTAVVATEITVGITVKTVETASEVIEDVGDAIEDIGDAIGDLF